jgi:hypothetical protein
MRTVGLALLLFAIGTASVRAADNAGTFDDDAVEWKDSSDHRLLRLGGVRLETLDPGTEAQKYRLFIRDVRPQCRLNGRPKRQRAAMIGRFHYDDGTVSDQVLREFANSDGGETDEETIVSAIVKQLPLRVEYVFQGGC